MGDTGKTLRDDVIANNAMRARFRDIPLVQSAECQRRVNGILLGISDFWHLRDTLNDGVGETTGAALEATTVVVADTNGAFNWKGIFLVSGLEEADIVVQGRAAQVVLQRDNVRIVERFIRVLALEDMEGGERERGALPWGIMGRR